MNTLNRYIPQSIRRSILHKSMLWLGLPIIGVAAIAIGVSYQTGMNKLETQAKKQLNSYLLERSKRESQIFQLAHRNHAHLKTVLQNKLEQAQSIDPNPIFTNSIHAWNDGTHRNFPQGKNFSQFNSQRDSTVFIGKNVELTEDLKRQVIVFQEINRTYGPAWHSSFINLWINSAANVSTGYWPGVLWAFETPASTDINREEYGYIAHKDKNPSRSSRWTGLYFDAGAKQWMVSLVTPVDDAKGDHIATIGNDIALNDLIDRTRTENMPGTRNFVISREGQVIADSTVRPAKQNVGQRMIIQQLQSNDLSYILEQAKQLEESVKLVQSPDRDAIIGIAQLQGTDWYFVTLYPKEILSQQAFETVAPLLIFAVFAVLFEVILIYIALRRQVDQPLRNLLQATSKLSEGEFEVQLPTNRLDEFGELSRSFTKMAQALQESFAQLNIQNETLEIQVHERTQTLTATLQDLQTAQAQLIQSEKMSSLGQMVAGIAHEINNPVSFIHGNLQPATEYITDLLEHLNLYQQQVDRTQITNHAEDIDLQFLTADLPKLLESMRVGTVRIREIVLGLRNFSRLDESDLKLANIHDGIESTLLILNHRFQNPNFQIRIEKQYGEVPPIHCYPSQLNQVIMNLLGNSIDALEEAQLKSLIDWKPQITITTHLQETQVVIAIHDNGCGIPEQVKARIFDPFFTTKDVGQGTGLGLSISHKIVVEKHRGTLTCDSIVGQGTCFTIQLPIH